MEPERLAQVLAEIVESGRLPAAFPQLDPLVVKGLRSIFHNTKPSPLCPRTPCANPADTVFHYFNNAGKTTILQPVFDCRSCKHKFVMNGRLRIAPIQHRRRPRSPAHRDCSTSSSTSAAGCKRMQIKGPAASEVSISQYGCQSWMMADKAGQPASATSLISGSKRPMADHERPQQLVKRSAPMHYASCPNSGAAIRCSQVMQHNSAPANNIFVVSSPTNHLVQNPCLLVPHGSDPQNKELAYDGGLSSEDTFAADLESQLLLASSSSPTCGHPLLHEQKQAYCEYGQQPVVNYQQEQAEQDVFWEHMKELQEAAQLPTVPTTATSTTTTNCTAGDDAHWFKAATIGTTAIDHDDDGRLMSDEVVGGCDPVLQENVKADVQCEFRQPQDHHQQTPHLTKQYSEVQAEQDILILQYMQKEVQEAAEFSTTMTNCTGAGDADADWLEASMGTTVDVEKLLAEFGVSEDHQALCGEELWGCLDHLALPPGLEELCTAAF